MKKLPFSLVIPIKGHKESELKNAHPISYYVELAKSGERSAVEYLLKVFNKDIYCYVNSMIQDMDRSSVLTEETFLYAFKNISILSKEMSFKVWLISLARKKISNHLKEMKREGSKKEKISSLEFTKDTQSVVEMILSDLNETDREILLLIDLYEGFSSDDVAKFLLLKSDVVKSKLRRARDRFVKSFEEFRFIDLKKNTHFHKNNEDAA